ncbi:transferase [Pseudodesulfovibrio sp. JC047]|uniref:transferase n=1 Tax=Pseudodesulfovibrio sp. JC047 TaxID=2683199 RepID=UPI0013D03579|nr:transferase [Pseudodesulfovibrio sp. JC047]NDV20300.1 transferase [Pseudodesulfovibrio sp. JC047]
MKSIARLVDHIISRVNVNLKPIGRDVEPAVRQSIRTDKLTQYYAYYALSIDHPWYFRFQESNLGGSYFLGKCEVDRSVVLKSDIRGDELKPKGAVAYFGGLGTELYQDEIIQIVNSFLVKTLIHNNSQNPEIPEYFRILNTVAMHYSNIHGTTTEGAYLGAFATADLSVLHNCVLGDFAYVQAGDLSRQTIQSGRVWIHQPGVFEFDYMHDPEIIDRYVTFDSKGQLTGEFSDFVRERRSDFLPMYDSLAFESPVPVPESAFLSRYAVVKGESHLGDNCLVAQRACLENATLGNGSNAQENCFIVDSKLEAMDVIAHGGKLIHVELGEKVFVGFNSFLHGEADRKILVGAGTIVMPHTIIDALEPLDIPKKMIVWGYIRTQEDLASHSMSLDDFSKQRELRLGALVFNGDGAAFIKGFQRRIEHILQENGAYYDGNDATRGHAQKTQSVSYNLFQPYLAGEEEAMFPAIVVGNR